MRKNSLVSTILIFLIVSSFFPLISKSQGVKEAILYVSPQTGTIPIGNTFTVSFYVNSNGNFINAVQTKILFPPDKLQIVSPSTGKSCLEIWLKQPTYSNAQGYLELSGGLPSPGINTDSCLLLTVTFRVKDVGSAQVKFSTAESKVLLADGKGTDILGQTKGGIYELVLPPPAGPEIFSATHPDSSKWSNNNNINFQWNVENLSGIEGYSYVLDNNPTTVPDDIVDSKENYVNYSNVADGIWYFHLKAKRNGFWGGVSHYAVKIDTTPPALFPININPSTRTSQKTIIVEFLTTDSVSGIDHYEIKVVPLTIGEKTMASWQHNGNSYLFIEATSPYIAQLERGEYDIYVRAYDKAGNFSESKKRVKNVAPIFQFVQGEGLKISEIITIPWLALWIILICLIALAGFFAYKARKWHEQKNKILLDGIEKDPVIQQRIKELQQKKKEYGKIAMILVVIGLTMLLSWHSAQAQTAKLSPPIVTEFPENITNREIFYIGGKTQVPNSTVIIYLQNLETGEVSSFTTVSDNLGDWFYSHPKFLISGNYLIWTQMQVNNEASPPSPQLKLSVQPVALQFGISHLSYEAIYFVVSLILFIILIIALVYTFYHTYQGRKKHKLVMKEIKEAEEAVRYGFLILKRDIEKELELIENLRLKGELKQEEEERRLKLLKDLERVKQRIGKEVKDIELKEE
jgi:hypothetical protein